MKPRGVKEGSQQLYCKGSKVGKTQMTSTADKPSYVYTMEDHSPIKKNLLTHTSNWMNLKNLMWIKRHQTEKNTWRIILFVRSSRTGNPKFWWQKPELVTGETERRCSRKRALGHSQGDKKTFYVLTAKAVTQVYPLSKLFTAHLTPVLTWRVFQF